MNKISQRMARSVAGRYSAANMQWHYEHGLVLQGIFNVGLRTGQSDLCDYVKSMYDEKITASGEILSYREEEYNLDQINPGKTLFLLYDRYKEEKYRIAIEKLRKQLVKHPRTNSGGFWHKQIYPYQMWLDGLYMQAPFYAQYENDFGDDSKFADIEHQFTLIESKTRDDKTGLLYHAWDESRKMGWSNPDTGCSPHFWGRAMGWYCMAIVDVMEIKSSAALTQIARRLIDPLLKYQDKQNGLWYQVLDRGGLDGNYTESSASSMFVYFLTKMLNMGLVEESNRAAVKEAAKKAFDALVNDKIREEISGELHLTDICKVAGLGGNPYRDGSYEYYVSEPKAEDDFKGVGPFIFACLEQEALGE